VAGEADVLTLAAAKTKMRLVAHVRRTPQPTHVMRQIVFSREEKEANPAASLLTALSNSTATVCASQQAP
jgi:hypothetical protein